MDSISAARNFFINQQGLSSDEADSLISKGLESYNQQTQPQTMMQMASNGGRIGYQMGGSPMGIQSMPMDYGQSLQVNNQGQNQQFAAPNYSSAQNITSNPLLNYGQPQLGQGGGIPLSMNRGGIARLGYQMGGEAGIPQMDSGMGMPQMNEQQALETIIKILIENGVPKEQAIQLAAQILQIFAQGGEPAVEAFANQLDQQEQSQEMASGGIAGYAQRQGYLFGGIGRAIGNVAGKIGNAIKSVAKSPLGRMALTIGVNMLLPGAGTAFGAALQAAAVNLGVQAISGRGINPLEALVAGAGGYLSGPASAGTIDPNTGQAAAQTGSKTVAGDLLEKAGIGNPTITDPKMFSPMESQFAGPGQFSNMAPKYTGLESDISSMRGDTFSLDRASLDPAAGRGSQIYNPGIENKPGIFQTLQDKTGQVFSNPMKSLENFGTDTVNLITEYPKTAVATGVGAGFLLGGSKPEDTTDEDERKRQEEVNKLLNYYGRNLNVTNPNFYTSYGAKNPFETAANGGIMGYKKGGSMVPPARQIEGGVIELDARKTGGYIPYGKKERHDDVPAMLAKDEFVFTSRAVKAAGGGDAKRGAAKMYALMKQLEGARN